MNKEQAIAALIQERERVDALYRQRDEGSGYQHELSGQLTGIRSCIQILRALPDESRWTREGLDALIETLFPRNQRKGHLLRWQSQGAKKLADALAAQADEVETVECEHASWDGRFCEFCGARLSQAAVPTHEGGENE